MDAIWEQLETTRAWRAIQGAATKVGILPEHLGMLAGKRLKKRDLFADPESRLIDLALVAAEKRETWAAWVPEEAFTTGLRLCEYAAASRELGSCERIIGSMPGRKASAIYRRLVWRAGGSEDASGLQAIIKSTAPENWRGQLRAAQIWRDSNLETETRRLAEIKIAFPDFSPSSPKWGAYLRKKIEEAGIRLERPGRKGVPKEPDESTLIIGESHGRGTLETMDMIGRESRDGATLLTVEEPKDGSWKPLMGFLLKTKKEWGPKRMLTAAQEEFEDETVAARLATVAYARNLGLEICFVDVPSDERRRLRAWEARQRRRVIARGEPFDPTRPETAVGGPRALAATILHAYHHTLHRSKEMAKAILAVQRGSKLIHIGGALHARDMAEILAQRGSYPRIYWSTDLKNPLAEALGLTKQDGRTPTQKALPKPTHLEKEKGLTGVALGTRRRGYEELHHSHDI